MFLPAKFLDKNKDHFRACIDHQPMPNIPSTDQCDVPSVTAASSQKSLCSLPAEILYYLVDYLGKFLVSAEIRKKKQHQPLVYILTYKESLLKKTLDLATLVTKE